MNKPKVSHQPTGQAKATPPSSRPRRAIPEEDQKILGHVEKQNILRMLDDRMLNEGFEIVTEDLPVPFSIYAFRKERALFADISETADENGKSPVMMCVVDAGHALYVVAAMPMEQETDPDMQDYDIENYVHIDKERFPNCLISRERILLTEREDVDVWMNNVKATYMMAEIKFLRDGKSAAHAKTLPSFPPVPLVDAEALRAQIRQHVLEQGAMHRRIQEIAIASRIIQYQIQQTKKSLSIVGAIAGALIMTSGAADVGVKKTAEKARETVMMNVDDPEIAIPVLNAVTVAEETFVSREENPMAGMASDLGGGALGGALIGYGIAALAGRVRVRQFKEKNKKDILEMG
ncbi:hypothetical protein KAZ92_01855 [Candidatus Gracilibacteria bacterium]|nr:hypothetical protein [Candidatus Gracilibacteria bacterium]